MIKAGIIGLGDIARKAYLPVISRMKVEIHLHTRNELILKEVSSQYRIHNLHQNLQSLIDSGIQCAFVHTATASHFEIVEQLLSQNIHVYVDKPITYDYPTTEKLVLLASRKNLLLTAGFNRRYAPAYQQLRKLEDPNMIIMQKNRSNLPAEVRKFIFDDFIHVIDTLLFLFQHPIANMNVSGKKKDGLLNHVVVQFVAADGTTAIGIMNRDSGTIEEKVEVFTTTGKWLVNNVTDISQLRDGELRHKPDDWASTLHKRGFEQIIETFLRSVASKAVPPRDNADTLLTHKICEEVVGKLNGEEKSGSSFF